MKSVLVVAVVSLWSASAFGQDVLSGKVSETMNSGGYTYARISKGKASTWVALPEMKLKVGEEVALLPGLVMAGFESKSLKRKFDRIVFSEGRVPSGMVEKAGMSADPHAGHDHGPMPEGHGKAAPGGQGMPNPHARTAAATPKDFGSVKTPKAEGPDAYTVAEVFARVAELAGKTVVVRGKVVRFNEAIMDRNWIHLQDGSGDPAKGTHDLVVTGSAKAKVGDTVTVRGTVGRNREFGMGYSYPVIVEKAALSR